MRAWVKQVLRGARGVMLRLELITLCEVDENASPRGDFNAYGELGVTGVSVRGYLMLKLA